MDYAWMMALAVGGCNSFVALFSKAAENRHCRTAPFCLATFGVAGITAFLTAFSVSAPWGDWRLWLLGATMGLLYIAATAAMLRANACWPPSIVWSGANMAFVVPILLSALFLKEPLRWIDAAIFAGVILMLAGLADRVDGAAATAAGERNASPTPSRRWLPLALVFVTNGALMMAFKLSAVLLPCRPPACLVAVIYGTGFAMSAIIMYAQGDLRLNRKEALMGLGAGTASSLSALAMLVAMRLPAAAAFPVVQGLSLSGGVLLCAASFHERLTSRKIAALAIGLGAMALTIWR